MRDDERDIGDEWTPSERATLDALPRTRVASDMMRARTLTDLRQRGLVRRDGAPLVRRAMVIAVAAGIVFVAGGVVGYRIALTRVEARPPLAIIAPDAPTPGPSTTTGHVVWF